MARGTVLLGYSAPVKARVFKNLGMPSSLLSNEDKKSKKLEALDSDFFTVAVKGQITLNFWDIQTESLKLCNWKLYIL